MSANDWNRLSRTLVLSPRETGRLADLEARFKSIADSKGMAAAVSYMNRRCLTTAGAAYRAVIMKSMRDTNDDTKVAKPGHPPMAHTSHGRGRKLKRLVTFQLEGGQDPHTVVIGPTLIRSRSRVPRVMEFGGTVQIEQTIKIKPNGRQYQKSPTGRKMHVASTPAKQQSQMQHVQNYYGSLSKVKVQINGVRILPRPFAAPAHRKMLRRGVGRFWFNKLRAVR